MSSKDEVDALFDLPLADFVGARNALAQKLSRAGEKERAAEVKKLQKPSIASWTLNQLARRHRAEIDRFLRASDRLFRAQVRAMSGAAAESDFREASAEQRAALGLLLERAAPILESAGHDASRTFLDRIAKTLRAVVLDEAARARLEEGRLTEDLEETGFDALAAQLAAGPVRMDRAAQAPARVVKARAAEARAAEARAAEAEVEAEAEAEAESREAKARSRAAEAAARKERVEAAREALAEAREAEKTARSELREAERELAARHKVQEEAREAHAEAVEALEEAQRAADDAKKAANEADAAVREAAAAADEARSQLLAATREVEQAATALDDAKA